MMRRKIGVIVAGALLALSLSVSGCGTQKEEAPQTEKAPSIAHVALYMAPVTDWDPAIAANTENQVFLNTYETLLKYESETDSFKPVLATEYTKSADGLVWTFKLRQGVKFHDGTDFNADAVKFSIDRTMRMKKGASYIWSVVKEIKVIDADTVQFTLTEPAPLDIIASSSQAALIYSPTAVGQDDQKGTDWFTQGNICGTGPYMLQSQVAGNGVVLTRFEDYWGGWSGNHFDKVVFKLVGENSSRRQLIESGEADVATNLLPDDLIALQSNPNVQVVISDAYKSVTAFLNTQKEPLKNKLVRQAIAFSFPYDGYVKYVKLGQFGSIGVDPLLPKGLWGALDQNPYTYDLEKAKDLLEEAGYAEGELKISVTNLAGTDDRKKTLELWKSELAKIGVTLDIQNMQSDAMLALARRPNADERQDIIVLGNWPDIISPMSYYASQVKSSGSWSFSYFTSPEIDQEIDAANAMSGIDRAKAEEMFQAIGKKVAEECITINFGDDKSVMVLNKNFKGFKPNSGYESVVFMYDCYREE
ncbi:ABC transporter substrate-binding protein [Candidatus Formimonas warabiya]|uniref:Solute-binding protein family 5 domain-containing protein n=1 Tax=Formimonas warabiya TaxID=1761012 RepID=A0A3G1KYT4_FORW1|nr:ABC transporter substrate-binding protein [Candidatus Formimonas warabiya]ATW27648.1 hypothetical protein DCMF_25405 [Candidatus Formimonas warabiya]